MNRILLATDGSQNSRKAVDFAIDMAKRYDARLDLLHVVKKTEVPADLLHLVEAEEIEDPPPAVYLEKVGMKIIDECGEVCQARGMKHPQVKTFILRGDPAKRIIEFAEEKEISAIVMGNRGTGTLASRLLGSVSRKVTHYAPCTCIIVK